LSQRPLQLILARNFLASIGTPAFLVGGTEHRIEASSLPIVDGDRFQGAIVVFWPVPESGTSDLPVLDRERA
jgi:hypothetical protein